jgi:hypothetical protein
MEIATIITLVIAILSACISIFTALVPTWLSHIWSMKAGSAKAKADFNSKKNPLLLAAIILARELHNFLDLPLPQCIWVLERDVGRRYHAMKYMCYLFAVFFLRFDELSKTAEFLDPDGGNRRLIMILYRIQKVMLSDFEALADGWDEAPGLLRRSDVDLMVDRITMPSGKEDGKKEELKNMPREVMGYNSFARGFNPHPWQIWEPFIELHPWKEGPLLSESAQIFLGEFEALVMSKGYWSLWSEEAQTPSTRNIRLASASPERPQTSRRSQREGYPEVVTFYRAPRTSATSSDANDKIRHEIRTSAGDAIKNEIDNQGNESKTAGVSVAEYECDHDVKPQTTSLNTKFRESQSAPVHQDAPHATSKSDDRLYMFQDIRGEILYSQDRVRDMPWTPEYNTANGFRSLLLGLQCIGYQQLWNYLLFQSQENRVEQIYEAYPLKNEIRFRKLQHRLLELIIELDPKSTRIVFKPEKDVDVSKGHRTDAAEYKGNIPPVRISWGECECQLPGYCKNLLREPPNKTGDEESLHDEGEKAPGWRFMGWLTGYMSFTTAATLNKSENHQIEQTARDINVPLRSPGIFDDPPTQDRTSVRTKAEVKPIVKPVVKPKVDLNFTGRRFEAPSRNAVVVDKARAKSLFEAQKKRSDDVVAKRRHTRANSPENVTGRVHDYYHDSAAGHSGEVA